MKIKIALKKNEIVEHKFEEVKEPQVLATCSSSPDSSSDMENHIREYFLEPLKELIRNEGVNNGYLIADVDALGVIKKIIKCMLKKKKISIIEILEKAAFEDCSEEKKEPEPEVKCEDEIYEELDEDEEDEVEEEEEEEDEEEEYDEYDLEEAKECDAYAYEEDESMDG